VNNPFPGKLMFLGWNHQNNLLIGPGARSLDTSWAEKDSVTRFWILTAGFLLTGYLCMSRTFAYLGIPAINVFVGEVVLGLLLLTRCKDVLGSLFGAMTSENQLSKFAWCFYLFACYGAILVLRGFALGYPVKTTLQGLVFHLYPFYFFLGLWLGRRDPNFLAKFFRWIGWVHGVYGILYVTLLSPLTVAEEGLQTNEIAVVGQPYGSAIILLGLLTFEKKTRHLVVPLILNAFVLLAMQVRGEWVGFFLGFVIWSVLSKKITRMLIGFVAIALLLGVGYVSDFEIPAPATRGGKVSTRNIIGRAMSAFDPDSASKYSDTADETAGTVEWRKMWWEAIWDTVNKSNFTFLLGFGYGYPLTGLVTYLEHETWLRSPHNIFFFCLAYGGWLGVALFTIFQLAILRMHWLTFKLTGSAFGIGFQVACLFNGLFTNFFEAPQGGIPYYTLTGLAVAPLFSVQGWQPIRRLLRSNKLLSA
jgi:hypothetical protein